jgi:NDP-sugar pyrophosphorylase family protein
MAKRRTGTFSGCTGLLYVAERAVTMADLRSTTAIILAGGLGTRLRPVVSDRPKVLAEVAGRPFLAYLLEQVAAAGVRRLVLCTGYRAEAVEAAFGRSFAGMHLLYSPEVEPLGTGGALRQALTLAESDPLLAMNGDSYLDMPLAAISARHDAHGGEGTVAVTLVPDTGRFGRVRTAEDGRILAFEERGTRGQAGWINAGIYLLSRRLLAAIPPTGPVSLEREQFPKWIAAGLYACPSEAPFLDIGTPETYATAEDFFAARASAFLPGTGKLQSQEP